MNELQLPSEKDRETIRIATHLIQCYLSAREGLKTLGILRTDRSAQADYAEWIVARLLNLTLCPSAVQKGIDATDINGKTYQIKCRVVRSLLKTTSFDIKDIEFPFDFLAAVFLDERFNVVGVLRVPYALVKELGSQTGSSFRFRWNQKRLNDLRLEKLFWSDNASEQLAAPESSPGLASARRRIEVERLDN